MATPEEEDIFESLFPTPAPTASDELATQEQKAELIRYLARASIHRAEKARYMLNLNKYTREELGVILDLLRADFGRLDARAALSTPTEPYLAPQPDDIR